MMTTIQSLPIFFASSLFALLLGNSPAHASPASSRAVAQAETSTPTSNAIYEKCREQAKAVVTLYSGAEIGSGSIVSPNGLIMTNYHVVQEALEHPGQATVYVKLSDGTRYTGKAFAPDPRHDLALVRIIPQKPLSFIPLADPDKIQLGEPVCAIGNPFGTASIGVGTLKDVRPVDNEPQADLKSNLFLIRGNSGGPLLNDRGEMIGINKSIQLSSTGENTGISFATSIRVAQKWIDHPPRIALDARTSKQLSSSETSLQLDYRPIASGGILGAILDPKNLTVRQIVVGSPSEAKGLRPGDRLLKINGLPVKSLTALKTILSRQPMHSLQVQRQQSKIDL